MPGPLSVTVIPASAPSCHARRRIPPSAVYLTALSTRLLTTWPSRSRSPSTTAAVPVTSMVRPFAAASGRSVAAVDSATSRRSTGRTNSSSAPWSACASASRLSTIRLIRSTSSAVLARTSAASGARSPAASATSASERMTASGVRRPPEASAISRRCVSTPASSRSSIALNVSASRPTSSAVPGTGTRSSSRSTLISRALSATAATGRSASPATHQPVAAATSSASGPPVSMMTTSRCTAASATASEVPRTSTRTCPPACTVRARTRSAVGDPGTRPVASSVCPPRTSASWAGEIIGWRAMRSSEASTTVPVADSSCAPESLLDRPDRAALLTSVNSPPARTLAAICADRLASDRSMSPARSACIRWTRYAPSTVSTTTSSAVYEAVSRTLIGSRTGSPHPVPDAARGADQRPFERPLQLAAQVPDVDVHDVGQPVVVVGPDVLQDPPPVDHLARVAHEELQQRELLRRQVDRPAVAGHRAGRRVQLDVFDTQPYRPLRGTAPDQRPQPGQQLGERERLDQVVVRPGVQPADPVADRVPGGQHENGHPTAPRAQRPAHLHTGEGTGRRLVTGPGAVAGTRKHDVEQDRVVVALACVVQRLGRGDRDVDGVPLPLQPATQRPNQLDFVVDDENAHVSLRSCLGRVCPAQHETSMRVAGPAPGFHGSPILGLVDPVTDAAGTGVPLVPAAGPAAARLPRCVRGWATYAARRVVTGDA